MTFEGYLCPQILKSGEKCIISLISMIYHEIREIMHFSPLFRIGGHKYPSKVIKNAYEYYTFSLLAVAMPHFR